MCGGTRGVRPCVVGRVAGDCAGYAVVSQLYALFSQGVHSPAMEVDFGDLLKNPGAELRGTAGNVRKRLEALGREHVAKQKAHIPANILEVRRRRGRISAVIMGKNCCSDYGRVLQDWGDLGRLGRDMTISSVGEMLAARYGLAVLVLRAMHTGEMVGELYTRHGNAGDCVGLALTCAGQHLACVVALDWWCLGASGCGWLAVVDNRGVLA
jgi:hypothetical protein